MPLAAALVRRGGDVTMLDRHGRSPLDLVKREQDVQDIAVGHFKAAERSPMLVSCVDRGVWVVAFVRVRGRLTATVGGFLRGVFAKMIGRWVRVLKG